MSILTLIEEHQQRQRQAETNQKRKAAERVEKLWELTIEVLNKHLPDLVDHVGVWVSNTSGANGFYEAYAPVQVEGLVQFWLGSRWQRPPEECTPEESALVTVRLCNKNPARSDPGCTLRCIDLTNPETVIEFLSDRRQEQLKAQKEEMETQIKWAMVRLGQKAQEYVGGSLVSRAATPDEAGEAYEALKANIPNEADREEWLTEVLTRYNAWLRRYEQVQEQIARQAEQDRQKQEQQRQAAEALQQECDKYAESYRTWLLKFVPIAKDNFETLISIKAELAGEEFQVARLERGIVASQNGRQWTDTDIVEVVPWADGQIFDKEGWVQRLPGSYGPVEKWLIDYDRIVGISDSRMTTPDQGNYGQHIEAKWSHFNTEYITVVQDYDQIVIWFSPLRSSAEIEEWTQAALAVPPAAPDDDSIPSQQAKVIRHKINAEVLPGLGLVENGGLWGLGGDEQTADEDDIDFN